MRWKEEAAESKPAATTTPDLGSPRGKVDRWAAWRYAAGKATLLDILHERDATAGRPVGAGAPLHRRHGPPRPPPSPRRRQGPRQQRQLVLSQAWLQKNDHPFCFLEPG